MPAEEEVVVRIRRRAPALVVFHAGLELIQAGYWRARTMICGRVLDVSGEHYTVSVGLAAYALERAEGAQP